MSVSQILLSDFEAEVANTRKILAVVPDGRFDYQPHEKSMALGRLASHVAEMPLWMSFTIDRDLLELDNSFKPTICGTNQELLDVFDANVAKARVLIGGVTDEAMDATWSMKWNGQTVMSLKRSACLRGMCMNHMIHHRAQLSVYLRLLDVAVPGMYGPSADEKGFA